MKNALQFLLIIFASSLFSCSPFDSNYYQELETWYQHRNEDLKAPRGYLRLVGLFWLDDGETYTLGSGDAAQIQIQDSTLESIAGTLTREGDQVFFEVKSNNKLLINGSPVPIGVINLVQEDKNPVLSINSFEWFVIKRGDYVGIRLFDLNHQEANKFTGANRYKADKKWNVKAKLIQNEESNTILVPDVLGQLNEYESLGFLEFELDGKPYSLQTQEYNDEYFIVLGDETNSKETYQGGRFLYVPKVDENGFTYIDFNKAINPPCIYSTFTTCPLPPENNRLALKITAGEKRWKKTK